MPSARDVAEYFLEQDRATGDTNALSNLKLQKLAYYAQGFYLAVHGEPLFDEGIEAWAHGPVVPTLYHALKEHGSNMIPWEQNANVRQPFTEEQSDLLDEVFEVYGQFSAWKLRDMSHADKPWVDHEANASVIPHDEMQSYFVTLLKN